MGQHWIIDVITGIIFAYLLYRIPKEVHLKIHHALNYLAGHYGICERMCEKNIEITNKVSGQRNRGLV